MYRLLIVDDEDKTRNGIANYIPWNELGYEVAATAANGREALTLLSEQRIDVMLCDVMMPVLTGLELMQIVSERRIGVKTVFLSGFPEFEYAQRAMEYGVKSYVLKPTRYQELSRIFTKLREELDAERGAEPEGDGVPDVIPALEAYVRRHYADASLQKAAEAVHLSPCYVSRLFKQKRGMTFYDFVLRTRMEAAADLLARTSLCIYEIGERVGYKNTKSFLNIFKRYYKLGPNAYRKGRR